MRGLVKIDRLSADERYELRECVKTVTVAAASLADAAVALRHIRDHRLYRETHRTFEAFCTDTFRLTRQHVCRLIDFGTTLDLIERSAGSGRRDLSPMGDKSEIGNHGTQIPGNERQTRPLAALPIEQRHAAWAKAVELAGGEQPTGAQVALVVRELRGELAPASSLSWVPAALANISRLSPENPNEKAALELISKEVQARLSPNQQ